ncbi:outer membrane lipid asymmetry maintenance protein MlaD [Carnimonas nigrificans]|uniref:outer membrane lipid asymmetry maintenance protein MlaD n=1 Tax=Carnimonas nigrificans TaxID=64323 RepID=UPI00046FD1B3|nr:outer membrane lipid asymmetry maintenance protein MlaD [Carnimonas nigrificans]
MKRTRGLEVGVGLFVVVAFLGLVFLGLKVSGLVPTSGGSTYTVTADFGDIGGLKPNSRVTMSGVTVGRVVNIDLDPKWLDGRVTMEISDTLKDKLSSDSTAAILTSGLLGEQYVGLTTGADTEMIKDGGTIRNTQQAMGLESLIQQFVSGMGGQDDSESGQ